MHGSANKLKEERNIKLQGAVSGTAKFDGSKDVTINTTQSNTIVLTGSDTVEALSRKEKVISYPGGYTVDNSVIVSVGIKVIEQKGYNYVGDFVDSASTFYNAYTKYVNLSNNGITIAVNNPLDSQSITYQYKIVLMKIA